MHWSIIGRKDWWGVCQGQRSRRQSGLLLSGDLGFNCSVPCGYVRGDLTGWDCCRSRGVRWEFGCIFQSPSQTPAGTFWLREMSPSPCSGCSLPGLSLLSAHMPGKQFLLVQQQLKIPWHLSFCPARHGIGSTVLQRFLLQLHLVPSVERAKEERVGDVGARRLLIHTGTEERFKLNAG